MPRDAVHSVQVPTIGCSENSSAVRSQTRVSRLSACRWRREIPNLLSRRSVQPKYLDVAYDKQSTGQGEAVTAIETIQRVGEPELPAPEKASARFLDGRDDVAVVSEEIDCRTVDNRTCNRSNVGRPPCKKVGGPNAASWLC